MSSPVTLEHTMVDLNFASQTHPYNPMEEFDHQGGGLDVVLYIASNWTVSIAGCLILSAHLKTRNAFATSSAQKPSLISRDLEILLFLGAVARVYWSCSPPEVWAQDPTFAKYLHWIDLFCSLVLWTGVFIYGRGQARQSPSYGCKNDQPIWSKWTFLATIALILGFFGDQFIHPSSSSVILENGEEGAMEMTAEEIQFQAGWPLAGVVALFNLAVDTLSMVPQMWFISTSHECVDSVTSNFIGLLCVARLLRMLFWGSTMIEHFFYESYEGMWPFVIPDLVHTIIMGEYVFLWCQKLKRDGVRMLTEGLGFVDTV